MDISLIANWQKEALPMVACVTTGQVVQVVQETQLNKSGGASQ